MKALLLVLLCASAATAQAVSMDEAYARLRARQAASTQPSGGRSTTAPSMVGIQVLPAPGNANVDLSHYSPELRKVLEEGEKQRIFRIARYVDEIQAGRLAISHLSESHRPADADVMRAYVRELYAKKVEISRDTSKYTYLPEIRDLATDTGGFILHRDVRVLQKIDDSDVLLNWTSEPGSAFWVTGIDASRAVDGQATIMSVPLQVSGTRTYDTVAGATRTVFLLAPLKLPEELAHKFRPIDEPGTPPVGDPGPPAATEENHPQINQRSRR